MLKIFYYVVFFKPLYNGLILLLFFIPGGDVGLAVVIFTILVKIILFPLSQSALKTQRAMKEIEPEIAAIKAKYKDKKQEQATQIMTLYKERKINPFSSIFSIFIQIPIIITLYQIFLHGGWPNNLDTSYLYSFVHIPSDLNLSMNFLGLINISQKSLLLAFFAGLTQYFQSALSLHTHKKADLPPPGTSLKDDLMRSMNLQMKYVLPIFVFFIAWKISGVIALYWVTSNLFTIGQELYLKKKMKEKKEKLTQGVI